MFRYCASTVPAVVLEGAECWKFGRLMGMSKSTLGVVGAVSNIVSAMSIKQSNGGEYVPD